MTENQPLINVVTFSEMYGVSLRDTYVLEKIYKRTSLKSANDWYYLLQSDFDIPIDITETNSEDSLDSLEQEEGVSSKKEFNFKKTNKNL